MSPTLITDPNAPPDPNAVRPIPDAQYIAGVPAGDDTRFNPVPATAPQPGDATPPPPTNPAPEEPQPEPPAKAKKR